MIHLIEHLTDDEQDRYYRDVKSCLDVDVAKDHQIVTLMAILYLKGETSVYRANQICSNFTKLGDALVRIKNAGMAIERGHSDLKLIGFDDGEPCMMTFKNTHAPRIRIN